MTKIAASGIGRSCIRLETTIIDTTEAETLDRIDEVEKSVSSMVGGAEELLVQEVSYVNYAYDNFRGR